MQNTPLYSYLLLYFYLGLRWALHLSNRYYKKYRNEFEENDMVAWLAVLLFWPLAIAVYALFGQRGTAIRLALYYAFVPWKYYEKEKHYKGSYFIHLLRNVGLALKWILFLESKADRQFERDTNKNF